MSIQPYYSHNGITIYHGDCREVLPTIKGGSVDLVLTDPPYGIGESNEKNATRGKRAKPRDYGHYEWDKVRVPDLIKMAVSKGKEAIVFGGNYYTDVLPPSSSWIVWDKKNGDNDFADCELAWTSHKRATRIFEWRWAGMLQQNSGKHKEERFHPTQKPVALMNWIINHYSNPGDMILDPFMGSGTTLVAAKQLQRRAIGIEIEERYCEIAAKRLSQEVLQFPDTAEVK